MTRAPYVMLKAATGFAVGKPEVVDTTLGWRLVNPEMERRYPPISLGMTAEVVAERYGVTRADQDAFALESAIAGRWRRCGAGRLRRRDRADRSPGRRQGGGPW